MFCLICDNCTVYFAFYMVLQQRFERYLSVQRVLLKLIFLEVIFPVVHDFRNWLSFDKVLAKIRRHHFTAQRYA